MTKSDLIRSLSEKHPDISHSDMKTVVNSIIGQLSSGLAEGRRIEIRGFGGFDLRKRRARLGRNPKSGESVEVPARRLPHFKAGKVLREEINDH